MLVSGGIETAVSQEQDLKIYEKRDMIYVSNSDGSDERELAEGFDPSLSPDGTQVVFVEKGLNIIHIDGTNKQKVIWLFAIECG